MNGLDSSAVGRKSTIVRPLGASPTAGDAADEALVAPWSMTSSQTHEGTEPPEEELARLRLELAALKASPQAPPAAAERRGWWRPVVAGALILLAAVLAPLSVLATWG